MSAPEGARSPAPRRDRLRQAADPRSWSLALRVVLVTTLLSTLALLAVGAYLSTVIADGLYEQRRDRVLEETVEVRDELGESLAQLSGATSTQQQDAVSAFVQSTGGQGGGDRREVALVPVETTGTVFPVASSDRTLFDEVDDEFAAAVAAQPDAVSWRSIGREDETGRTEPALLVGTRVVVPGAGSYDLYLIYSLQEEQETLAFVQRVILGGGLVLLSLILGIAIAIARMVTTPLKRAAHAAERMAAGDLTSRVEVAGADELARVGESFNDMARSLEQKVDDLTELSRVQQRFVSDVSHELRTPLTTVRMAASIISDSAEHLDAPTKRAVELLESELDRFESLLTDLLEVSRHDAGMAELSVAEMDVRTAVEDAVGTVSHIAESAGVEVELDIPDEPLIAEVDSRRVERILRNLIANALDHSESKPVTVTMRASDAAVAVSVRDRGVGLKPGEEALVFNRFWRADPSRVRRSGGTGLGLAIALEDAKLHGGRLDCWGSPGEGSCFRLTIPRHHGGTLTSSPLPLTPEDEARRARSHSPTPLERVPDTGDGER